MQVWPNSVNFKNSILISTSNYLVKMSLIISLYLSNGIVMSADSTCCKDQGYISTNANKIYVTTNSVGISTCGNRTSSGHNIEKYLEDFIETQTTATVTEVANNLLQYIIAKWPDIDATFLVAGYEASQDGSKEQKKYRIYTKERAINECDYKTGAQWNGATALMSKLINQAYYKENEDYIAYEHYQIDWAGMNIQDGIDFCRFMTNATSTMMDFQNRITSVGGNIDILVIKPSGHLWISKKNYR